MTTLYTPTRDELATLLEGEPRYRLDQVWQGLYTQLAEPAEISNVPKALRERLGALARPTRRDRGRAGAALAGAGQPRVSERHELLG